jgi:hypothetical protein
MKFCDCELALNIVWVIADLLDSFRTCNGHTEWVDHQWEHQNINVFGSWQVWIFLIYRENILETVSFRSVFRKMICGVSLCARALFVLSCYFAKLSWIVSFKYCKKVLIYYWHDNCERFSGHNEMMSGSIVDANCRIFMEKYLITKHKELQSKQKYSVASVKRETNRK